MMRVVSAIEMLDDVVLLQSYEVYVDALRSVHDTFDRAELNKQILMQKPPAV